MKKLSLALSLICIFALLITLNLQSPVQVNNNTDLSALADNTKVQTSGKAISEKIYSDLKILTLDTGLQITCTDCPSYYNKTITAIGVKETYINRTQIKALSIKSIS